MKVRNLALFGIIAFPLIFSACGTNNINEESAGIPQVEQGHGDEVVFALWANPLSLDPQATNDSIAAEANTQIYEGLVTFNSAGELSPLLAESFDLIYPTVWEFILRQGVYFHDGSYFNAHAVKTSIDRLLDPERASPPAFILEMVEEVIAVDDYTVHFVTEFPFSAFPAHLTRSAGFIISPLAIEEEATGGRTVNENPVGTGPFMYVSFTPGEELRLIRNYNYWGELPRFQYLTMLVIPEPSVRRMMLETGEVNAFIASGSDMPDLQGNPDIDFITVVSSRLNFIGFNTQVAPFNDARVRQAINMVIDLDSIIYSVQGMAVPAIGPVPPTVTGSAYEVLTPLTGTVEEARELLAEAGFPDGFSTTIILGEGRPLEESFMAQILQSNLMTYLNIDASIQVQEWGTFLSNTGTGNHEIFVLSWTVITGDADYALYPLFHSSNPGTSGRRTHFVNDEIDSLLERSRIEVDQEARNEIYTIISQKIIDEVPLISVFYPIFAIATNGIDGLEFDFTAMPYFHSVTLR